MSDISWETTSKKKLVPVVDGYKYRIKSSTSTTTYWECVNNQCRARLHTYDLERYKMIGVHNHVVNDISMYVKQFETFLKAKVVEDHFVTAKAIYDKCLIRLSESIDDLTVRRFVRTNYGSFEVKCLCRWLK